MKTRLTLLAAVVVALAAFAGKPRKPDCNVDECVVAVDCVKKCGGPVVQTGCCPCPAGTLNALDCPKDAGR